MIVETETTEIESGTGAVIGVGRDRLVTEVQGLHDVKPRLILIPPVVTIERENGKIDIRERRGVMIVVGTETEEIVVTGGIGRIEEWRDVMLDVMTGTGRREETGTCSNRGGGVVVAVGANLTVMPFQCRGEQTARRA